MVVLAAAVGALLLAASSRTGGELVYALDDAYIHMAVGRNLADHGVWGVTRYAFTSSTSSLLWPLLLALADLVAGAREATPLVLNLVFAAAAVLTADRLLAGATPGIRLVALAALVLLSPLPTLVVSGMEHALHIAAVLWLLDAVRAALADGVGPHGSADVASTRGATAGLLASAAVATAARYESLFLIAPAAVVLWRQGRGRAAIAVVVGGASPLAVYGLVSVLHGWPPVPNSLLLKGAAFEGTGLAGMVDRLGGHALQALVEAPHLLVLVAGVLVLSAALPASPALRALDAVFVAGALLHAQLAAIGWLYRYEAYLVAIGIVLVARHAAEASAAGVRPRAGRLALVLAVLISSAPLLTRAIEALDRTPRAAKNIYEQQYQMGLFLRGLPAGATVMANDIGAIAWLADVRLVDLYGLATRETAQARRAGRLDRALLARLTAETRPAAIVIYRSWFADALPDQWVEVASWRVPEKVVVADRTVSFFAADAAGAAPLARALASFQPRLPPRVAARLHGAGGP